MSSAEPSSSATSVRLAAAASRAARPGRRLRDGFATLDPAATHLGLAPIRMTDKTKGEGAPAIITGSRAPAPVATRSLHVRPPPGSLTRPAQPGSRTPLQ
jgi:hypothetical protein